MKKFFQSRMSYTHMCESLPCKTDRQGQTDSRLDNMQPVFRDGEVSRSLEHRLREDMQFIVVPMQHDRDAQRIGRELVRQVGEISVVCELCERVRHKVCVNSG